MAATVIIHYGKSRVSQKPAPKAKTQPMPIQQQQADPAPTAVPAQDQYRTIVRPRFIGDSFVCVPERVPTTNADGSPIKSPGQILSDWWNGK